jgi:hypothetical protein
MSLLCHLICLVSLVLFYLSDVTCPVFLPFLPQFSFYLVSSHLSGSFVLNFFPTFLYCLPFHILLVSFNLSVLLILSPVLTHLVFSKLSLLAFLTSIILFVSPLWSCLTCLVSIVLSHVSISPVFFQFSYLLSCLTQSCLKTLSYLCVLVINNVQPCMNPLSFSQ